MFHRSALYQLVEKLPLTIDYTQHFTNKKDLPIFGAQVLYNYLIQENPLLLRRNGPLQAIIIADHDSNGLNLFWEENEFTNLKDIVSQVSTVESKLNENKSNFAVWYTLKYNRSLTTENIKRIINLNIMRISWVDGSFRMFEETFHDIKNRIIKFSMNQQSLVQWINDIDAALYFEKYFQFKFEENPAIWHTIINKMKDNEFLEYIIEWNTTIKKYESNQVPMFLISAKPSKELRGKDLIIIFRFYNPKYLWRISWKELLPEEKLEPIYIFPNNLNESLILNEKDVYLNDFFNEEIEFKAIDINKNFNLPDSCFEISMHYDIDDILDIDEHFKEEKDGIIILRQINTTILEAACTTKTYLQNTELQYYQCTIIETDLRKPEKYVLQDEIYIQIDIFPFHFYITRENLLSILHNTETKYFMLNESPLKLKFTMDKKAADLHLGALESGHHCQEGTDKQISIIFPIHAENIDEIKLKLQGENKKRIKSSPIGF